MNMLEALFEEASQAMIPIFRSRIGTVTLNKEQTFQACHHGSDSLTLLGKVKGNFYSTDMVSIEKAIREDCKKAVDALVVAALARTKVMLGRYKHDMQIVQEQLSHCTSEQKLTLETLRTGVRLCYRTSFTSILTIAEIPDGHKTKIIEFCLEY
jgi:hypothetical protein